MEQFGLSKRMKGMGKQEVIEAVETRMYIIRGRRVMLGFDLAQLYKVPGKTLTQAVKRNIRRFPPDFMFQLNSEEMRNWRSQFVTSNSGAKMGLRRPPFAFTQEGVAMLSSVLRSSRAVDANIAIMRAFVRLRTTLALHKDLALSLKELERRVSKHDDRFADVFSAIRSLMREAQEPRKPIGFRP